MSKMVIGVTGTKAAGKDEFVNILREEHGFASFSLADIVREEAKKRGLPPTTANLQDIGNKLRRLQGSTILAEMTVKKISALPEGSKIVINSIRNPAEVEFLQREFGDNFSLIGIDADEEIRRERYLKRKEVREENFEKDNKRDLGEKELYGQQVRKCLNLARTIIDNNVGLEELREKTREILYYYLGIKRERES